MTWAENLLQNLITVGVLLIIFILIYCKMTGKTLMDLFFGIKDALSSRGEEVYDDVQGGFDTIR